MLCRPSGSPPRAVHDQLVVGGGVGSSMTGGAPRVFVRRRRGFMVGGGGTRPRHKVVTGHMLS